jgi:plasmid stabilization system protein ParE
MMVILGPRAERDLDEIALTGVGATTLLRLRHAIASLESNPERFGTAPEADDLGLEVREILVGKRRGTFRILFTVDGTTVNVRHIRRGSRGPVRRSHLG